MLVVEAKAPRDAQKLSFLCIIYNTCNNYMSLYDTLLSRSTSQSIGPFWDHLNSSLSLLSFPTQLFRTQAGVYREADEAAGCECFCVSFLRYTVMRIRTFACCKGEGLSATVES